MIEDEIVDGYLLPKGAFIIPNQWQLLHDENVYANPMEFNPDRFIAAPGRPEERDSRDFAFGFGRRSVGVQRSYSLVRDVAHPCRV